MKPLRLSLRAFGSYAGTFSVDFSRLGRHGIFAITGPTGAGKSTIFDALVYALYDDLPGFRENGNIRSQFADPATETAVQLDFEVHGRSWRIERAPTQHVAGRRGRGATAERKSRVSLSRLEGDGAVVAGTTVVRKPEVRRAVEELVGLSKEQFEQVVLIPQGKFEEVLKADTGRRAPLLRRLFAVETYGQVTEALKTIAATRQAAYEDATRAEAALRSRVRDVLLAVAAEVPASLREGACAGASLWSLPDDGCSPDELDGYVDEVVRLRLALDGHVGEASAAAGAARDALGSAREAAARWERWQEDLRAAGTFADDEAADAREASTLETARRLGDLRGALERWREATERRLAADAAWEGRREEAARAWVDGYDRGCLLDDAPAAAPRGLARRVGADAARLSAEAARYDRLAATAAALETRSADLADREAGLAARLERLGEEEAALSERAAQVAALEEEAAGAERVEREADALELERRAAARRAELVAETGTLGTRLDAARSAAEGSRGRLAAVRAGWRDGLAGRLARLLVEGEPCPTCGALEHPVPAPVHEVAGVDDAVLAEAERACERAEEAWRAAERHAGEAVGELAGLPPTRPLDLVEAELGATRTRLGAVRAAGVRAGRLSADLDRRRADVEAERREAGGERRDLDLEQAALAAARATFAEARTDFVADHGDFSSPRGLAAARAELATRLEALADSAAARGDARLAADTCDAVLRPVLSELGLEDPADLFGLALEPADLAARAGALDARRALRVEVRARLARYEAGGGLLERPEVRPFEEANERAERAHRDLLGRQAVVASLAREVAGAPALLEAAAKELAAARRALEEARTVAALCAGTSPAGVTGAGGPVAASQPAGHGGERRRGRATPVRISLENWVLADYLRQVLALANVRLESMTNGRYSLRLSDGVTDGRKPWGLDLSAFDVHTGQVRPATTLSGGETFMAALALALGLADVVSGGSNRHIGALFVDEGFGSLDAQALDAVIDVLRSLEDGGRVVGVISHVDDVQQALPTGISVRPSVRGSVAEVHYPDE
jgi:exonuclease SbcC